MQTINVKVVARGVVALALGWFSVLALPAADNPGFWQRLETESESAEERGFVIYGSEAKVVGGPWVQGWVMLDFFRPQDPYLDGNTYLSTQSLASYHCQDRKRMRLHTIRRYSKSGGQGQVVELREFEQPEEVHVTAGSAAELQMVFFCRRFTVPGRARVS